MTHRFEVWAPTASAVEVEVGGRRHPLAPAGGGWWGAAVDGVGPGDDYSFRLDGGDPRPDPRSRRQPRGVHGRSQLVDVGAFRWSDAGFPGLVIEDAVLYELHVGTFSPEGTFDGVAARLDHLVGLGVTALELLPVADFPGGHGWGYDGVHLWSVHEAYGGPAGLARLVDACHRRGLAVVLDVVYNHLGPDGNYLGNYGPYFTDRYRTPWGQAVNVDDSGSDEVRAFFVENALAWLRDYHLDGLRLDAVHAIVDTSATHLLEELAGRAHTLSERLGKRLAVIAESDLNDPRLVRPVETGGYGVDAQWSDDFHHALHAALTGERSGYYADYGPLELVAKALTRGVVFDGLHSRFRGRRHGRPYDGVPAHRLLGYLQNHDQVGNRAVGERSGSLLGVDALRAAAATVLLAPFTPMLFAGEEWGATTPFQYFTDHGDAELAAAVSRGRRREFEAFGWSEDEVPDPQDPSTFERSRLDWSEPGREPHAGLLRWHRDLIALRRARPALRDGRLDAVEVVVDDAERRLVMRRHGMAVAWNLGTTPWQPPLPAGARRLLPAAGDEQLAPGETAVYDAGG